MAGEKPAGALRAFCTKSAPQPSFSWGPAAAPVLRSSKCRPCEASGCRRAARACAPTPAAQSITKCACSRQAVSLEQVAVSSQDIVLRCTTGPVASQCGLLCGWHGPCGAHDLGGVTAASSQHGKKARAMWLTCTCPASWEKASASSL